jgi:hypothetical protein
MLQMEKGLSSLSRLSFLWMEQIQRHLLFVHFCLMAAWTLITLDKQHNLPALTSTVVIDGLQGVQATDYLNGYNIAVPHLIDNRLNALKVYIGRRML